MRCPVCENVDLKEVMTRNGVLVDWCPKCEGIWLDKGEIFYFTKVPNYLRWKIEEALKRARPSSKLSPKTGNPMLELSLLGGRLIIDYCPQTQGIWLDKGELERLPSAKEVKLYINIDRHTRPQEEQPLRRDIVKLPNLGLVSGITLFFLYALIALVLIILVNLGFITPAVALFGGIIFALLQFLLSPFIMDITLRWCYRMRWTSYEELPSHLREFLLKMSYKHKINPPRVGIIPDGAPNAFTYGHTPYNARIVITSGIMDLLEPQELEAVVGHEIGHIVHWDMLFMTVAYVVPLILYYIYRTLIKMRSNRREDKTAGYRYAIAIISYILYIISEYIVLWFSRIREYFADRFSGENTDPNNLASALVKIGYGLSGKQQKTRERKAQLEAIKAMGIFDPASARALAIASYHPRSLEGQVDKETLKGAMRWDLWNPWALYYEIHSTHPLIAKRLLALSRQSLSQGKAPYIIFDERRPESFWDEFFVDLFMASLPLVGTGIGVLLYLVSGNINTLKSIVFFVGVGYLFKTIFSYRFDYFPEMNISSLLKKVKVSGVRPVPCTLKGKIIGRGIPGLIWSEDFILQDDTGIIFLDYRQPLAIWNFLFGLLRARHYIGEDVEIKGWYRRSPVPFVEIKSLTTKRGTSHCYVFNVKISVAIILMIIGIGLFLF